MDYKWPTLLRSGLLIATVASMVACSGSSSREKPDDSAEQATSQSSTEEPTHVLEGEESAGELPAYVLNAGADARKPVEVEDDGQGFGFTGDSQGEACLVKFSNETQHPIMLFVGEQSQGALFPRERVALPLRSPAAALSGFAVEELSYDAEIDPKSIVRQWKKDIDCQPGKMLGVSFRK
ncbi:MAG: hypothetical protein ACQEVA_06635 [Myxococcota bacterium]